MSWQFLVDGYDLPPFVDGSYKVTGIDVATVSQSEAGTDIRELVRSKKHIVSASFLLEDSDLMELMALVENATMRLTCFLPEHGESVIDCYLSSGFNPTMRPGGILWSVDLEWTEF